MEYGLKEIKKGLRKYYRLFLPTMHRPTYHSTLEEAMWALRLRGYRA